MNAGLDSGDDEPTATSVTEDKSVRRAAEVHGRTKDFTGESTICESAKEGERSGSTLHLLGG